MLSSLLRRWGAAGFTVFACLAVRQWYWFSVNCDPLALVQREIGRWAGSVWRLQPYELGEGVIFLKTHKTASSSVTSVIWHNLCETGRRNCFLPPSLKPGKTWDFRLSRDWRLMRRRGGSSLLGNGSFPYNVWLYHATYSTFLFSVVPQTRRMISIVRRPGRRFESAWHWYNHSSHLQTDLTEFAIRAMNRSNSYAGAFKYRSGLDATTEELTGIVDFRNRLFLQRSAYEDVLRRVARRELILLVAERFDESLLVLGHLLGWSVDQLVSFKHKVGAYRRVDEAVCRLLDQLQPFDLGLWRLANAALNKFIADNFVKSDFDRQLDELQKRNAVIHEACHKDARSKPECSMMLDNNEIVKARWGHN